MALMDDINEIAVKHIVSGAIDQVLQTSSILTWTQQRDLVERYTRVLETKYPAFRKSFYIHNTRANGAEPNWVIMVANGSPSERARQQKRIPPMQAMLDRILTPGTKEYHLSRLLDD